MGSLNQWQSLRMIGATLVRTYFISTIFTLMGIETLSDAQHMGFETRAGWRCGKVEESDE